MHEKAAGYYAHQGSALLQDGRVADGLEALRRAVALDPRDYRSWLNLGMNLGDEDVGERACAFQQFLRFAPGSPQFAAFRPFARDWLAHHGFDAGPADVAADEAHAAAAPQQYDEGPIVALSGEQTVIFDPLADGIVPVVDRYLGSSSPLEAYFVLAEHRELFSPLGETLMIAALRGQRDPLERVRVARAIATVHRAHEVGLVPAFAEAAELPVQDFESLVRAASEYLPEMRELVGSTSAEHSRDVVRKRPALVSDPAVMLYLRHLRALQASDAARQAFETAIWFLHECRRTGVEHAMRPRGARPALLAQAQGLARSLTELSDAVELGEAEHAARAALADRRVAELAEQRGDAAAVLGAILMLQYERTGREETLAEAIAQLRDALAAARPGSWDSAERAGHLAQIVVRLAMRSGQLALFEEAVAWAKHAASIPPPGTPGWNHLQAALGAVLREFADASGAREHLDAAIAALSVALRDERPEDASYDVARNNLAVALLDRHELAESSEDLDEAILLLKQCRDRLPPGGDASAGNALNLARGLRVRALRTDADVDLDDAIELLRTVVHGGGNPARVAMAAGNLGNALRDRFERHGRIGDADEAIACGRFAVAREEAARVARAQHNLGKTLLVRYPATGKVAELDEACSLFEAVRTSVPSRSEQTQAAANLGLAYLARHRAGGDPDDFTRSESLLLQSMRELEAEHQIATLWQIASALAATYLQRQQWADAARTFQIALRAFESLVDVQIRETGRAHLLRRAQGEHTRAAYAFARAGRLDDAVVALEQARARAIGDALQNDPGMFMDVVDRGQVATYERYRIAFQGLEQLRALERDRNPDATIHELRAAQRELRHATDELRRVGSPREVRATDISDIREAAFGAPLVYLAPGFALIVPPDPDATLSVVWLPSLTVDALEPILSRYLTALRPRLGAAPVEAFRDVLDDTTAWLWEAAVAPVLAATRPFTRITIIAAGCLGFLPFHAAWTGSRDDLASRRYAIEEAAFRYAPSARALRIAAMRAHSRPSDSVLAIADPRTTRAPLARARDEAIAVTKTFERASMLGGSGATRAAVLAQLHEHDVLHFACHASADLAEPLESGVLLASADEGAMPEGIAAQEDRLQLRELLRIGGLRARLVFLSACETGMIGRELPDEALSLGAGFLAAGVPAAIQSLWPVYDTTAAALAVRFYQLWKRESLSPDEALRRAQCWLLRAAPEDVDAAIRDVQPTQRSDRSVPAGRHPEHWAAFMISGV